MKEEEREGGREREREGGREGEREGGRKGGILYMYFITNHTHSHTLTINDFLVSVQASNSSTRIKNGGENSTS